MSSSRSTRPIVEEPSDGSSHARGPSARYNASSEASGGAAAHGRGSTVASATVSGNMSGGTGNGGQENASSTRRDRAIKESVDAVAEMAQLLDTGLDRSSVQILMGLCECGVNPEALAAAVKELRSEAGRLGEGTNRSGGPHIEEIHSDSKF
eukprot:gb/GECG01016610.1/.p1 GENE.gb/GECG01016610.1/~~gb/GECG01016610.1/.p1  ORF type:complete len:152 (+),score=21.70 gb/GECG01016610.1/:1-456(+)